MKAAECSLFSASCYTVGLLWKEIHPSFLLKQVWGLVVVSAKLPVLGSNLSFSCLTLLDVAQITGLCHWGRSVFPLTHYKKFNPRSVNLLSPYAKFMSSFTLRNDILIEKSIRRHGEFIKHKGRILPLSAVFAVLSSTLENLKWGQG